MAFAPSSTYFDSGDGSILGMFVEKDHGNLFEYSVGCINSIAMGWTRRL